MKTEIVEQEEKIEVSKYKYMTVYGNSLTKKKVEGLLSVGAVVYKTAKTLDANVGDTIKVSGIDELATVVWANIDGVQVIFDTTRMRGGFPYERITEVFE